MFRQPDDSGPGDLSKDMALRVAVFGGVALVVFAILFFRLWFLQILNGEEFLADANSNRTRELRVSAPRGDILDRDGNVLVANRTAFALQVNHLELPADEERRRAELARVAELADMSLRRVRRTMHRELELVPGAPVTLRRDVENEVVYYLEENKGKFPGIDVERVFVRRYPSETLAAHLLGSVGEVDKEDLEERRYKSLQPGDEVGQDGVEDTYDRFLRGEPGVTRIQVDAFGQPTAGGKLVSRRPVPGHSLQLTIDPDVQAAGEAALAGFGLKGAFVTMDIHTGEILGMGSFPTYDPTLFTEPLTQKEVDATYRNPLAPLANRAIAGLYPTGSIFKIITALAALENDRITPEEVVADGGAIMVGTQRFQNAGGVALGPVELERALQVSSDVYFYLLGLEMWKTDELQEWAEKLGVARPSGIDLPGAEVGLMPSQEWRNALYREGELDRPWSAGDNVQLATGQGDLQTNPLQMAIAYAALGNGGTIVTPHVGMEVDDADGRVIEEFDPPPRRRIHIDPGFREDILDGLHAAAQVGEGTSYEVFGGFPVDIAGKTGTAQRPPYEDQSWYAALAPYPDPDIVTVATLEEGGFGADAAAPVTLDILEAYFDKQAAAVAGPNGGSPG
jgi:penicillin-binding protein 2